MIVAVLNNNVELMCNMYEGKIHLPNTGGAFYHNDLNWFKYYDLIKEGVDVDAVQSPQIVVFLSDTVEDKCEFYIIPSMYKHEKWHPIVEVWFHKHFPPKIFTYDHKANSATPI